MNAHRALALAASCLGVAVLAVGQDGVAEPEASPGEPVDFSDAERRRIATLTGLGPPPADETNAVYEHPLAARLGQRLFFDTRVSADGSRSCASCHDPQQGFADGLPVSETLDGTGVLTRNTPSLWNVAYNRWFFWDGRADSIWSQALKPTEAEVELGGDRTAVAHLIAADATLRAEYEAVFGPLPPLEQADRFPPHARPAEDPEHPHAAAWSAMDDDDREAVDRVFANFGKALAAYQRGLVSRRSRFDTFAEGLAEDDPVKLAALSPGEQRGLAIFAGKGRCRMCHAGPNFSDGEFHGTGVAPLGGGDLFDAARYEGVKQLQRDPFNALGRFSDDRDGPRAQQVRTLATGPETWGEFKTPSLRNVARSAPYMHQGQFATLAEVVRFYSTLEGSAPPGHHQEQVLIPLALSEAEQADLVAFLEALTDESVDPSLLGPPAE